MLRLSPRFSVFALAALLAGCQTSAQTPPPPVASQTPPELAAPPSQTPPAPPVAAKPVTHSSFNADRAYEMLVAQCDLGPRPPRSDAHAKCKAYILKNLTPFVDKVDTQDFSFRDRDRKVTLPLTNIIGVINPAGKKTVCLFTHWDTRPTSDQELDEVDKKKPIIGADDGASGTAALLELARVFHAKKPSVRVILLFVDGEDWGPGEEKMYLGAIHFAANPGVYRPDYAILLDMIGDKDLGIHREITSERLHPDLNDKVWLAAAALGYGTQFPNDTKWQISDDHDSFNAKNIPAIDLIDFDYAYWHTTQDTAGKCSPQSLKAVGDVIAKVVYDEK